MALAQEITVVLGVTREAVKSAKAGDIVSISVTGFMPRWTQTLVSHAKVRGGRPWDGYSYGALGGMIGMQPLSLRSNGIDILRCLRRC